MVLCACGERVCPCVCLRGEDVGAYSEGLADLDEEGPQPSEHLHTHTPENRSESDPSLVSTCTHTHTRKKK